MSEQLPDVQLTSEQARIAELIWRQLRTMDAQNQAARLIVSLQGRIMELELKLNKAEIERAWAVGKLRAASWRCPLHGATADDGACRACIALAEKTVARCEHGNAIEPTAEGALRELRQRLGLPETTPAHCCGLQGFDPMRDRCPACAPETTPGAPT